LRGDDNFCVLAAVGEHAINAAIEHRAAPPYPALDTEE
jgi:hypothetical protein